VTSTFPDLNKPPVIGGRCNAVSSGVSARVPTGQSALPTPTIAMATATNDEISRSSGRPRRPRRGLLPFMMGNQAIATAPAASRDKDG